MEPYEKIYVSAEFLETEHGAIGCPECHGGDPDDGNWQTAHRDVVRDPTFPDADNACGGCHEEISSGARYSLHYTLAPFSRILAKRMTKGAPRVEQGLAAAREKHCDTCHASCGQCHVSRSDYIGGGFLAKHQFQKTPPMDSACASCHGGRVFAEYTGQGKGSSPDVHFEREKMACPACHKSAELHADGRQAETRLDLLPRPSCLGCHPEADCNVSEIESHRIHRNRLACQVCHAQGNKNCFQCHVGTDKKGLPYFKCSKSKMMFKIGRNPEKAGRFPWDYVVLRHPPASPSTFDFYVKGALENFDAVSTWKRSAPHSIARITPRNAACANCHGQRELFLGSADLEKWEQTANAGVIVKDEAVPEPIETPPGVGSE